MPISRQRRGGSLRTTFVARFHRAGQFVFPSRFSFLYFSPPPSPSRSPTLCLRGSSGTLVFCDTELAESLWSRCLSLNHGGLQGLLGPNKNSGTGIICQQKDLLASIITELSLLTRDRVCTGQIKSEEEDLMPVQARGGLRTTLRTRCARRVR